QCTVGGLRGGASRGRRAVRRSGRRAVLRAGRGAPSDGRATGRDQGGDGLDPVADGRGRGPRGGRVAPARATRRGGRPPAAGSGEGWGGWVGLAEECGDAGSLTDFTEELTRRAASQHAPTMAGVTLASLHSAKGLEWDAVFVVGLVDGVLPSSYAKTDEMIEE